MVGPPRPCPRALLICLAVALIAGGGRTQGDDAASGIPSEYQIKAAYLYYFSTFVEWPPDAFARNGDDLVIGVLGEDPFGEILDNTIRGKAVYNKRLIVKRFESIKDARESHILFISTSEQGRLPNILEALKGANVLTVGEIDGFASRGGGIGFRMEGRKVRFDINVAAVERSRIKVSAQLMKLGRIVKDSESGGG